MKPSTVRVAELNESAVARYKDMRSALMADAGEDRLMCEVIVTCQLALLGHAVPFKLHAMKLFEASVSKERLQRLVASGLGVTMVIPQIAQALDWIDEAHAAHSGAAE